MILLILILIVVAVGVVLAVIVSRSSLPGVEEPVSTQSFAGVPTGPVHADDIDRIRLDCAFRGYRMDQVDAVLGRLSQEIAVRDQEIDRLRAQERHGDL
ncbi:MAG: DivIVA domain-containing protein [Ornithinimicrobium sp.]